MITPRLTSFAENFCDPQLLNHQIFLVWARLYQCVFCKQADTTISVLREVSENAVRTHAVDEKNWKRLGVLEYFHLPDRA